MYRHLAATLAVACLLAGTASAARFPMSAGYTDGADFSVERNLAPGVVHRFDSFSTGPLTINTAIIDGSRKELVFETEKGHDDMFRGEPLPLMITRLADPAARPLVAINADFWGNRHMPIGMFVDEGTIWKGPWTGREDGTLRTRSIFAFDDQGNYFIGLPHFNVRLADAGGKSYLDIDRVNFHENSSFATVYTWARGAETEPIRENQLRIALQLPSGEWLPNAPAKVTVTAVDEQTTSALDRHTMIIHADKPIPSFIVPGAELTLDARLADLPGKVIGVVGGGPRLVVDGVADPARFAGEESMGARFVSDLHPRTAIGLRADGKTVVMTVIDGRQTRRSRGIDLNDLAQYMISQGCVQAMNLDGGGSSTMVARGELLNFPSDGVPRSVSNAVIVRRIGAPGKPSAIEVTPKNPRVPVGATLRIEARPVDDAGEVIEQTISGLQLGGTAAGLTSDGDGAVTPQQPGVYTLQVSSSLPDGSTIEGTTTIRAERAGTLAFEPSMALLEEGGTMEVLVRALDESGEPFYSNIIPAQISVPSFVSYDPQTRELKGLARGAGRIEVSLGGLEAALPVSVGIYEAVVANSFEKPPAGDGAQWLELARADAQKTTITVDRNQIQEGESSWRLDYTMLPGGTTKINLPIRTPLPGRPAEVGLWVYGDKQGQWLRGELQGADGSRYYLDFTDSARGIDWEGWRLVRASIHEARAMSSVSGPPKPPLTVNAIYLVQPQEAAKRNGTIWLDALSAINLPADIQPAAAP